MERLKFNLFSTETYKSARANHLNHGWHSPNKKGDCQATASPQMWFSYTGFILVFCRFTFRVVASFLTGAVTTLAFFVAFSELIKLFFSIVINYTSNIWIAD